MLEEVYTDDTITGGHKLPVVLFDPLTLVVVFSSSVNVEIMLLN